MTLRKFLALVAGGFLFVYLLFLAGSTIPRQWTQQWNYHSQENSPVNSQINSRSSCQYKVCAARFGIHTNIIIPVSNGAYNWQNDLTLPLTQEQYLGFGWGERDWYLNPPPDNSLDYYLKGSRSLLLPNAAALRVQRHDRFPSHFEIRCGGVDRSHYLALIEYIQRSFQRSAGRRIQIRADPQAGTAFYEATGRYSFLHNSNHWTAEGLRTAKINTPLWAGFSQAVMRQIKPTC